MLYKLSRVQIIVLAYVITIVMFFAIYCLDLNLSQSFHIFHDCAGGGRIIIFCVVHDVDVET